MSINLDTEKGLQRKPKKFRKHNPERMNQENNSNSENKIPKRKNFNSEQAKTEKVKKDKGERVILTFDGEKPFLLVEETSSVSDEFSIVPTLGEPYLLIDTIGALTNNSITWSSNGIDYYIVSDAMSQIELIEIASSISSIPTMK